MTTNNQAALQAAATVFSEARADVRPETVTGMAWQFKLWLDRKDAEAAPKVEEAEETVSHHISCASRIRQAPFPCDCEPVSYEELKPGVDLGRLVEVMHAIPPGAGVPKPGPRRCDSPEWCSLPKGHDGHHHLR